MRRLRGVLLRARALPANTFALSWLVVLIANPTDLFTAGFQLSFLCVAVLIWGIPRWFPPREPDAARRLIEESRSRAGTVGARARPGRRPGVPGDPRPRPGDGPARRLLAEPRVPGRRAHRPAGDPADDGRPHRRVAVVLRLAARPGRGRLPRGPRPVAGAVRLASSRPPSGCPAGAGTSGPCRSGGSSASTRSGRTGCSRACPGRRALSPTCRRRVALPDRPGRLAACSACLRVSFRPSRTSCESRSWRSITAAVRSSRRPTAGCCCTTRARRPGRT